ncbi:MAG: RimK family alpha-L-glutamate ligase [Methylotenera sp.]
MKVVVFTDDAGWHGAQLKQAFAARDVEMAFASLKDCLIDCSGKKPLIKIPQFEGLPKAVFVRGITGGTLQQITTRLNVLHMLKALGVLVYNDGRAIERTVDKTMTSFLLHNHGVATPQTWVCESRKQAYEIISQYPQLVIKPLFGSQGQGVRLADKTVPPLPMDAFVDGVFYLQIYIEAPHDYRVFILNNQVVAAMKRSGEAWLHNVAQGAQCENVLNKSAEVDVLDIALQAASVLDIAYCGVDVIRDKNGKLYVLEVNSIPAWRGLQGVSNVNIARVLVDDFMSHLHE